MKHIFVISTLILLCSMTTKAQQVDTVMLGVYVSDMDSLHFIQMRDSLHLNSFELRTGLNPTRDATLMNNAAGLKLINQRQSLRNMSTAQRMIYQAEEPIQPTLFKNYFADVHPEREIITEQDTVALKLTPGLDAGYMVKSARPNDEYRYGSYRPEYWATFRLKAEGTHQSGDTVVKCIAYCLEHNNVLAESLLTFGQFPPNSYKDFVLRFPVMGQPFNPQVGETVPYLTGGVFDRSTTSQCDSVDLQVYWYGSVTTYLDKVTVEDWVSRDLVFGGQSDHAIKQEAATYGNLPLHTRFYLEDEPPISTYLAFNYTGNRIKDTLGHGNLRAKSITAMYRLFERFLVDATPGALMIDPYFLFSDIPHPSITNSDSANAWGIEPWNYTTYVQRLQSKIDEYLQFSFRPAAEAAAQDTLIFIPQLHGIAFHWGGTTKYRSQTGSGLRPPSPSEMRLQYNLALAYGAKGFLGYPFGTDYFPGGFDVYNYPTAMVGLVSNRLSNGYRMDHYNNTDTVYGSRVWTGYKEKWNAVAELNKRIASIGDTLLALRWKGTRSWNTGTNSGTWSSILLACTTKDTMGSSDATVFVETGHLQRGTTDYLVVVNRRCADNETRDISLTTGNQQPNWLVTDVETNRSWVVKSGRAFTDRFRPGDGKIYRVEAATVAGTNTFSQLKFAGGGVLTLASNANIHARCWAW